MFIRVQPILSGLAVAALATAASVAFAQAPPPAVENPSPPPPATSPAPTSAPQAGKAPLSLSQIESLLQREGIRVRELEVRDHVVEAEGRDANNRKVEVIVDRRSGEILSRRFDD